MKNSAFTNDEIYKILRKLKDTYLVDIEDNCFNLANRVKEEIEYWEKKLKGGE